MKLEFSRHILEKYSNIIFHENPSIENRVVPCGQTDRLTDITKLIIATHNSAKALRVVNVLLFLLVHNINTLKTYTIV